MAENLTWRPTVRLRAWLGSSWISKVAALRDFRLFSEEEKSAQRLDLSAEEGYFPEAKDRFLVTHGL
jgi:hypothetical protein